jgi:hypothetical protein
MKKLEEDDIKAIFLTALAFMVTLISYLKWPNAESAYYGFLAASCFGGVAVYCIRRIKGRN